MHFSLYIEKIKKKIFNQCVLEIFNNLLSAALEIWLSILHTYLIREWYIEIHFNAYNICREIHNLLVGHSNQ